jgi:hypothetical protein
LIIYLIIKRLCFYAFRQKISSIVCCHFTHYFFHYFYFPIWVKFVENRLKVWSISLAKRFFCSPIYLIVGTPILEGFNTLFMFKPTISSLIFISFKNGIDRCAVYDLLVKLGTDKVIKSAHIACISRFIILVVIGVNETELF